MTTLPHTGALPDAYRRWVNRLLLVLIIWVAFFLRVHRLDTLPPGLFVDEAFNGLDVMTIGDNGRFPLYFPANNGREPLFFYLEAITVHLLGLSPWALRLTSAFIGLLAVPLAYVTAQTLTPRPRPPAFGYQLTGLIAASLVATLFWHVQLSRLMFRTILLPGLALTAVFFFWRGWQSGRRRWFVLAGLALGVSQYTYLAARLLPLVFLGFAATQWLSDLISKGEGVEARKRPWTGLVWLLAVALVVALPLLVTLARHPDYASGRTGDVSVWTAGSGVGEIISNGWLVTRMFLDEGDPNLRHNLPGRAALDIVQAVGFWTGLALCLWRWRRPQPQLVLWWLAIMLLPTLLSTEAPHYLRASGAIGPIAILTAWGWVAVFHVPYAMFRVQRPAFTVHRSLFTVHGSLFTVLLLLSALITAYDYFGRWANTLFLYDAFEALETEAAVAIQSALEDGPVYLTPDLAAQNSRALDLLAGSTAVRPFPTGCLLYPAQPDQPTTFLVRTQRDKETLPRLQALFPHGETETAVFHPDTGEIFFEALTVAPGDEAVGVAVTAVAQFGGVIQLNTATVQPAAAALDVRLVWYARQSPAADYTLFLHLYPAAATESAPLAQLDAAPCLPTGQWSPGDVIQDAHRLSLPPDLPPGVYTLALGWYRWPTFDRLPISGATAVLPHDRLLLQSLTLP